MVALEILPIGDVNKFWLEYLKLRLKEYFENVLISPPEELPLWFNERGQVLADILLDDLTIRFTKADKVLGVISRDITVANFDYIFGLASLGGRCAVISPVRLMEGYYRGYHSKIFLERLLKEALHELGHTFGLNHCSNENCNMKFSSSVYEIDKKSLYFCDDCLAKVFNYVIPENQNIYAANGKNEVRLMKKLFNRLKNLGKKG